MRTQSCRSVLGPCASVLAIGIAAACAAQPVSMITLRDGLVGLADSGTVAVFTNSGAIRSTTWTATGGFVQIPYPGTHAGANTSSISRDGRYVAGTLTSNGFGQSALRYDRLTNTTVALGDVPGGVNSSAGEEASSNGWVVGTVRDASGSRAGRWSEATGWQVLNTNPELRFSQGTAMSDDASVVAGLPNSFSLPPLVWTEAGGVQQLPVLVAGTFANVQSISADGQTLLGMSDFNPVIWRNGQIQQIHNERVNVLKLILRSDGRMAGFSSAAGAILWEEGIGSRQLSAVVTDLGYSLNGFRFRDILGISADGNTIAGIGVTAANARVSYILTLPAPGTAVALVGVPLVCGRRRRSTRQA